MQSHLNCPAGCVADVYEKMVARLHMHYNIACTASCMLYIQQLYEHPQEANLSEDLPAAANRVELLSCMRREQMFTFS